MLVGQGPDVYLLQIYPIRRYLSRGGERSRVPCCTMPVTSAEPGEHGGGETGPGQGAANAELFTQRSTDLLGPPQCPSLPPTSLRQGLLMHIHPPPLEKSDSSKTSRRGLTAGPV